MNEMKNENEYARDSTAAIGIGAMIVFIALILVAAVASAVIIQTGEKLQQNAQQTGEDTQQEIGGKLTIITAWIATVNGDPSALTITLVFETAAGSTDMLESDVVWTITCNEDITGDAMEVDSGDFEDTHFLTDLTIGTDADGTDTISAGTTYMVTLGTPACMGDSGEAHTMYIEVKQGGSTYELLQYRNIAPGEVIV